jgi:hypothetical protein
MYKPFIILGNYYIEIPQILCHKRSERPSALGYNTHEEYERENCNFKNVALLNLLTSLIGENH